jgi:protein TonB
MAYADQSQSSRRSVAIVLVVLLHVGLAYAFITGLAFNVIKKTVQDLKTFDVKEAVPPPPPPPPPKNIPPPPVVAPPPIVQTQAPPPVITVVPPPPPAPVIHETLPPPKPSVATPAKLRGDPNFGITDADYPSDALRANEEGVTRFSYDITTDGRMANCHVTGSSGSASLDTATCRLATRNARWKPALDAAGNPVETHGLSRSIRWQIPKD